MKKGIILFFVCMAMCFLNACGANKFSDKNAANTVKIAYIPITHALAVFEEAEECKENKNLNIELVKYGSWPELMDALNTGRVDGASVLIELAMKAKEQGIGLKAVALGHRDGNAIIVSKQINSMEELKGKTFAIPHRQSSHNLLLQDALYKASMAVDDLKIAELAPTEMASALASGQIDGYCVAEPFGAQAVFLDVGKVLYSSEKLWDDSLCCGLVLSDKFIKERPSLARNFVKAYKKAGNNLSDKQKMTVAKKYLKQNRDVLDISLKWISYDNLAITEDIYDKLTEKMRRYGLSDNPPLYKEFVDNTL